MRKKKTESKEEPIREALEDFLRGPNYVIHVKCNTKTTEVEIKGKKTDLQTGLAFLARILKTDSNLTDAEIREAVNLGLKDDEAIHKEVIDSIEKFFKNLN